jgi:molybdenum cofactor cytidylyltransferase
VLGQVIETIQGAGIEDVLVVAGGNREDVEKIAASYGARTTHNENFMRAEMLASIQLGLREQKHRDATLIVLGDQPQIKERIARLVVEARRKNKSRIVVPSYEKRRGHPYLIAKELWAEILDMRAPETMRDFLNRRQDEIFYVECDTPSVLQDLDTPEDYLKYKPSA